MNGGTPLSSGPSRLPRLDAVRGVAVMLVVAYHASFRFPAAAGDPVARLLRDVGWIGVDMFFALSGFLIASILLRPRSGPFVGDFFRRRVFRIVPLFVVALATYLLASLATGHEPENLRRLWVPALLLNGWAIPVLGVEQVPYTIAWSLSVEEFAYLVLGFSALAARRGIAIAVWASLALALAVRWGTLAAGTMDPALLYYFVPARLDAIAFGALGAMGFYARLQRGRAAAFAGGVVVFVLIVAMSRFRPSGLLLPAAGYAVFGLACGVWVAQLAALPGSGESRMVRALAKLGEVSYFIYLFHMFALDGVRMAASQAGVVLPYWPALALSTALVYAAARVSWRWFELPMIERGRRSARPAGVR